MATYQDLPWLPPEACRALPRGAAFRLRAAWERRGHDRPWPTERGHPGAPLGRPRRSRWRGWLVRNRRLSAALLLCVAAGLAVQQLTPEPAASVPVAAAVLDLPAGKVLAAEDIRVVAAPAALVPDGNFKDASALLGQQLAVAVRKGQLVTDTHLLGPGLLVGTTPGSAAVPLRMADASSVRFLSPGQLVNIIQTRGNGLGEPAESRVLASAVPVLWTSGNGGAAENWLGSADGTDGLVVIAAAGDQARVLAGASMQGSLFFVLVGAAPG